MKFCMKLLFFTYLLSQQITFASGEKQLVPLTIPLDAAVAPLDSTVAPYSESAAAKKNALRYIKKHLLINPKTENLIPITNEDKIEMLLDALNQFEKSKKIKILQPNFFDQETTSPVSKIFSVEELIDFLNSKSTVQAQKQRPGKGKYYVPPPRHPSLSPEPESAAAAGGPPPTISPPTAPHTKVSPPAKKSVPTPAPAKVPAPAPAKVPAPEFAPPTQANLPTAALELALELFI